MLFVLEHGKAKPENLPCGCKVIGNLKAIGIDGKPIQGLTGLNSRTGWMRIQRCVVNPSLLRRHPQTGRVTATEMGLSTIQISAPFELQCKVHGPLKED